MGFYGEQNNGKESISVNTRGIQLYNEYGFMPATLVMGLWNDFLTLKIHPTLEGSRKEQGRVYDYEKYVNGTLSTDKALTLLNNIKKEILPAIENKENKSVAVVVNKNSLIQVGVKVKEDKTAIYVGIFKEVNNDTKKTESFYCYEFGSNVVVSDFNNEDGKFQVTDDKLSEFNVFCTVLEEYVRAQTKAFVHTYRTVERFYKDSVKSDLGSIKGKLGISQDITGNRKAYKPEVFTKNVTENVNVQEVTEEDLDSYLN
jgi:hypothetical protein